MGFAQSRGDPDVHFRMAHNSGKDHYEYILVYVDDLLVLSYSCEPIMDRIVLLLFGGRSVRIQLRQVRLKLSTLH